MDWAVRKMGAHGTLEEALANVSSFTEADAKNERALSKGDKKRSSKDKDKKIDAKKASKKALKKERRRDSKKVLRSLPVFLLRLIYTFVPGKALKIVIIACVFSL